MNPVDQWLAINAKYFPTEQVQYIRQRLEAVVAAVDVALLVASVATTSVLGAVTAA